MGIVTCTQIIVSLPPGLDPGEAKFIEDQVRAAAEQALRQLELDRDLQVLDLEKRGCLGDECGCDECRHDNLAPF